jgi:alkyl sulfatase BDS1-like metallo-beta-lactamase superfamily hydrolase
MDRYYGHRFHPRSVRHLDNASIVSTLRVTLEPTLVEDIDHHVAFHIDDDVCGLHVRNGVAVPTDGAAVTSAAAMSRDTFIAVLSGRTSWSDAVKRSLIRVSGDSTALDRVRRAFEVEGLRT